VNNGLDSCSAYVNVPAPLVTDPCPYTISHDSPYSTNPENASGIYPVGITVVTWTITGISNNITTCEQVITVVDNQAPTIICPDSVFAIAEPPLCEVPGLNIGDPTINDNCPDPLLTWKKSGATTGSGIGLVDTTTFYVGVTYVTYIVTDTSGNADSCTFVVTINDQVPPTIIYCPEDTHPPSSTVRLTPPFMQLLIPARPG
jgi:hypothetical protein